MLKPVEQAHESSNGNSSDAPNSEHLSSQFPSQIGSQIHFPKDTMICRAGHLVKTVAQLETRNTKFQVQQMVHIKLCNKSFTHHQQGNPPSQEKGYSDYCLSI